MAQENDEEEADDEKEDRQGSVWAEEEKFRDGSSLYPMYFGISSSFLSLHLLSSAADESVIEKTRRGHLAEMLLRGSASLLGLLFWRAQKPAEKMIAAVRKAESEVARMKILRMEDAKANDKVMGMLADREQRWISDKRKLKLQIKALMNQFRVLEADKSLMMAAMEEKVRKMEKREMDMTGMEERRKMKLKEIEEREMLREVEEKREKMMKEIEGEREKMMREIEEREKQMAEIEERGVKMEEGREKMMAEIEEVKKKMMGEMEVREMRMDEERDKMMAEIEDVKKKMMGEMEEREMRMEEERDKMMAEIAGEKEKMVGEMEEREMRMDEERKKMLVEIEEREIRMDEERKKMLVEMADREMRMNEARQKMMADVEEREMHMDKERKKMMAEIEGERKRMTTEVEEERRKIMEKIGEEEVKMEVERRKMGKIQKREMKIEEERKKMIAGPDGERETKMADMQRDLRHKENLIMNRRLSMERRSGFRQRKLLIHYLQPESKMEEYDEDQDFSLHCSKIEASEDLLHKKDRKLKAYQRRLIKMEQELKRLDTGYSHFREESFTMKTQLKAMKSQLSSLHLQANDSDHRNLFLSTSKTTGIVKDTDFDQIDHSHSKRVDRKIKRLKQQLLTLDGVDSSTSLLPLPALTLLMKQVKTFQILHEKINELCERLVNARLPIPHSQCEEMEEKATEDFLEEASILQRNVVAAGQKVAEIQSWMIANLATATSGQQNATTDFSLARFAAMVRISFREVQTGIEYRIARILGKIEETLACSIML